MEKKESIKGVAMVFLFAVFVLVTIVPAIKFVDSKFVGKAYGGNSVCPTDVAFSEKIQNPSMAGAYGNPVSADFDGDGKDDIAIFNSTTGTIKYTLSSNMSAFVFSPGITGWKPAIGDFDADGKDDFGVFDSVNKIWRRYESSRGYAEAGRINFGNSSDVPVIDDYDGDGIDDLAVFKARGHSCFDRIANGNELGVDCGGSCSTACITPTTDNKDCVGYVPFSPGACDSLKIDENLGKCASAGMRAYCDWNKNGPSYAANSYHVICYKPDTSCNYVGLHYNCPRPTADLFVNRWSWLETTAFNKEYLILEAIQETSPRIWILSEYDENTLKYKIDLKAIKSTGVMLLIYIAHKDWITQDQINEFIASPFVDGFMLNMEESSPSDRTWDPTWLAKISTDTRAAGKIFVITNAPWKSEYAPYLNSYADVVIPFSFYNTDRMYIDWNNWKSKVSKPVYIMGGVGKTTSASMSPNEASYSPKVLKGKGINHFSLFAGIGFFNCVMDRDCTDDIGTISAQYRADYKRMINNLNIYYPGAPYNCPTTPARECTHADWRIVKIYPEITADCNPINPKQSRRWQRIGDCFGGVEHSIVEEIDCGEVFNPDEWDREHLCSAATCSSLGKTCGTWDDGCGGMLNCGTCSSGNSCSNGVCVSNKLAWPIECAPGTDCTITNYPDLNNDGIQSNCGRNIDGHTGTDIAISFNQMDAGKDVYAAADGTVLWVFDGKYDRCQYPTSTNPDCKDPTSPMSPGLSQGNTVCTQLGPYCKSGSGNCFWCFAGGNVVVIRHAGNPEVFATRYDHLKSGSILVNAGDTVVKGQKIAEVGSSGKSTEPHLHFEPWGNYYSPLDPWKLACSASSSTLLWANSSPWGQCSACFSGLPGTFNLQILDTRGNMRNYYLYVPNSYSSSQAVPLLFYFLGSNHHTYGSSTGLKEEAAIHNFIFVAPDTKYNTGTYTQWVRAQQTSSDLVDEQLILDILNKLKTDYNIDSNKVYATGFSNGAYFANLMAMRYSNIFAAIAPHSGGLPPSSNARLSDAARKYSVKFFEESNNNVGHDDLNDAITQYNNYGFDVQLYRSGSAGHTWDSNKATLIWDFLSSKRLN